MAVHYSNNVSPDDIGQRVTVRVRLPEGKFADTIGVLEEWSAGVLRIRKRDDSVANVTAADIVASKIVGDPPVRRSAGR
ncbi:hypothetical protein RIF23_17455 [Lipingzhangella sp. LS1_29]|uniref:Histone acetyltransferase Rv0428c-like SH3 domain-containing protein n=1 Tax=Lipingzhangella rawalii TaxID=2055835 RepID=A0ABU2HB45_9ACTN|nr:hypothetical protein [Lipingzhangella rawalii]MDS1272079.1 hypothetical protein [Lipingzhangella rawalii]